MGAPIAQPEPFATPRSVGGSGAGSDKTSTMLAGVLALLLGLYDFIGGGCLSLSALSPRQDVPEIPFYTSGQQDAIEAYVLASASLDPVNAAVGAGVGLVGLVLMGAGLLLLTGFEQRGLVGQVAFAASMVVDALQAVWLLIWYVLLWDATVTYVEAAVATMPDGEDMVGVVTAISVALVIAMGVAYFGIKVGLAGLGWRRCRRFEQAVDATPQADPVVSSSSTSEAVSEEGLDWALDEPDPSPADADDGPG